MIVNKSTWEAKTLGDVCQFKRGLTYPKSEESIEPTSNIVLRSNNVDLNTYSLDLTDLKYLSENYEVPADKKLVKDSILMCMSNGSSSHIGKVAFIEKEYDCAFGGFMGLIIPKDIIPKFLYYKYRSESFKSFLGKIGNGINITNLKFSSISPLPINIPSLNEQKGIVSELDSIQTLIDAFNAQVSDLDCLAKSIFVDMFGDPVMNEKGWNVTKLKSVTSLITNGNTPKGGEKVYVNDGIMFFRSQNVWRNELKLDDIAYIDEETNSALKSSILHHNDILITKTGRINTENSSLGRPALFTGEDNTANINGHVYLVRLTDEVNPIYYLYALLSDSFKELIRNVCVGAIDKRQLNRTHIEDFPVMLAPLALQEKFAEQVEAIEKQKTLLREQLADAEQLMAERMQYYFS